MATKKAEEQVEEQKVISLRRIENEVLQCVIEGLSPVIPHAWGPKALRQLRESHMRKGPKVKEEREPKNPKEEADGAQYYLPDGTIGLPATGFKGATVAAARLYKDVTMTELKQFLFVEGEGPNQLVRLQYKEEDRVLREDTPRNATGVVDLRYRYAYFPWSCTLRVHYPKGIITAESVLALVDAGGFGGVCDWRPSSPKSLTGTFGRYRVRTD